MFYKGGRLFCHLLDPRLKPGASLSVAINGLLRTLTQGETRQ